jgi:hypothetical protein
MRTVTKTVQNDSFFNFFSPPIGKIIENIINIEINYKTAGQLTKLRKNL